MSDKIIPFPGLTTHELPVDQVLEAAKDRLSVVLVVGEDAEGNAYFASSTADTTETVYLATQFIHFIMQQVNR